MERKAGIRFSQTDYVALDMESMTLTEVKDGESKDYSIGEGGGGIEIKSLYINPDTTIEMPTDAMFNESEIEGYQYLRFIVTNTSGSYEVEEWCEIEPLKNHGGQFVVSMPMSGDLYVRKIYRSSGAVRPSAGVFKIGATTENRNACIIKSVDCVKGVK